MTFFRHWQSLTEGFKTNKITSVGIQGADEMDIA